MIKKHQIISLTLFLCLVAIAASSNARRSEEPENQKMDNDGANCSGYLVYFGCTQRGKSSIAKLLTGNDSIECGNGSGISVTRNITLYTEIKKKLDKSYFHIDTIGFGENRLIYNTEAIKQHIEKEILRVMSQKNDSSIRAIIVPESYTSDQVTLLPVFQKISEIFGLFPRESIIILATKKNAVDKKKYVERKRAILSILSSKQIQIPQQRFIEFMTPCPGCQNKIEESSIDPEQYQKLQKAIDSCKPIQLSSINEKRQKIRKRALQIQKNNTTTQYVDDVKDEVRIRTVQKSVTVDKTQCRRTGFIFRRTQCYTVPQTKYVSVQESYPVKVPYKREQKHVPELDYCYMLAMTEFEQTLSRDLYRQKKISQL